MADFLSEKTAAVLKELGYSENNAVQRLAIPFISSGQNVLVIAPTGSGKTEAAMFPLMDRMLRDSSSTLIYITPLRSLNRDILLRLRRLGKALGLSVALRHGDTTSWEKSKISKNPPRVMITTPESLEGLLISPSLAGFLKNVRAVVIDECQEVTNNKRGIALSYALERLCEKAGEFQRVALSAFTSDPEAVARSAFGKRAYKTVELKAVRPTELTVKLVPRENELKELASIISESLSVLLFTNTRETAEWLGRRLGEIVDVGVHHGSLSREIREDLEREFKMGSKKALVCTSSLELGIDIGRIDAVIQYRSPRRVEALVQRIGRAGHREGGVAKGYVITDDVLDYLESLVISRRALAGHAEKFASPPAGLDVLAHEIVGLLLDMSRITAEDVKRVFSRSWYFSASDEDLEQVFNALQRLRALRYAKGIAKKTLTTRKYYALHVSMIPGGFEYSAMQSSDKKELGRFDREFVIAHCQAGSLVRLGGRDWRVDSVDYDRMQVWLSPASSFGLIPSWEGELIPVDREVAREVAALGDFGPELKALTDASSVLEAENQLKETPLPGLALVFSGSSVGDRFGITLFSPLGTKANMAFGIALSRYLEENGVPTIFSRDQYKIVLETSLPVSNDLLQGFFKKSADEVQTLYLNGLLSSPLYLSRLLRVCLRIGLIDNKTSPGQALLRKIADAWSGTWVERETVSEINSDDADVEGLLQLLSDVKQGKVPVVFSEDQRNAFFVERRYNDLATTLDAVNNRLLSSEVKLVCLSCGWENVYKVQDLPDKIVCPKCGSMMVGCLGPHAKTEGLVKKVRNGRKLSPQEKSLANELMRSSNLISQRGRYAAYVLAGRGIGPDVALRILNSFPRLSWPPKELVTHVIKAEADFNRTHMFWNS
ncbi:MAG: DEAD/DEAH box helicase [Thermoprotei archaeon]